MMDRLDVQRALLAIANAPRTAGELTDLLDGAAAPLSDLEALRLVRREGDRYSIAFSLFPADDVRRIRALSEGHARSLADSLLARRSEIEAALQAYNVPGVNLKDIAFIVLGCFSLDWDGLRITKAKGYRTEKGAARPDGNYVPWAEEVVKDPHQSYCYSSSNWAGRVGVVSFSDGTAHDGFLSGAWRDRSRAAALAQMLLAMRDGKATLASLAQAAKIPAQDARDRLTPLVERRYVRLAGDRYEVNFPVLSHEDGKMVARLREIGGQAIESWLAGSYRKLQSDLADLRPLRSGVPYVEAFNWIWHVVFGRANVMLVNAGLFADPYSEGRIWRGYTLAVFDGRLTR